MTKNILLLVFFLFAAIGLKAQSQTRIQPSQSADEKLEQVMTRNWYVIAKKCENMSTTPNVFSDGRSSSYYYTMYFLPDNNYDFSSGRFKIVYNDSLNAPVREGSYHIQSQPGENAGFRLIMNSPAQWAAEYKVNVQDEQHITLTLMSGDDQERCNMLYAISPQSRNQGAIFGR